LAIAVETHRRIFSHAPNGNVIPGKEPTWETRALESTGNLIWETEIHAIEQVLAGQVESLLAGH
jgi:hypothetical protein